MKTTTKSPNRWLRLVALLAALTLIAAACGSDGDSAATADADSSADSGDDGDGGDAGASDPNGDGILQVGIFGECEGGFAGFHEDIVAGASLPFLERGAESTSATSALMGFEGAEVAGTQIELVGIACGDDTADTALSEIRQLVEQDGAEAVLGPLSGDEGIVLANYALENPEITIINGTSGAQQATLQVQAPNFFRFNGDGAQWNAGIGDILHNTAGWETAAVIADDYGFGHTSAAGFIAEFCAAGGEVISRVATPLEATDYSSFIAQLPDREDVDGYFWVVGANTAASLQEFVNQKGDLTGEQLAGNLFLNPGLSETLGPDIAGAYIGGFTTLPGDFTSAEIDEFHGRADAAWDSLKDGDPSATVGGGFGYSFYVAGLALVTALEANGGDISPATLQSTLADLSLDAPHGTIELDDNRQAIVNSSVSQLVLNDSGEIVSETVAIVPGVDQTFGGVFDETTEPPSRDQPACAPADIPWIGNAVPVVDGVPQE